MNREEKKYSFNDLVKAGELGADFQKQFVYTLNFDSINHLIEDEFVFKREVATKIIEIL